MKKITYFLLSTMILAMRVTATDLHFDLDSREAGNSQASAINLFRDEVTKDFKSVWKLYFQEEGGTYEFTTAGVKIKGFNFNFQLDNAELAKLDGKEITLTAQVKTGISGVYRMQIAERVKNNWLTTYSLFHSGSDRWEDLTVTQRLAKSPTYRHIRFIQAELEPTGCQVGEGTIEIMNPSVKVAGEELVGIFDAVQGIAAPQPAQVQHIGEEKQQEKEKPVSDTEVQRLQALNEELSATNERRKKAVEEVLENHGLNGKQEGTPSKQIKVLDEELAAQKRAVGEAQKNTEKAERKAAVAEAKLKELTQTNKNKGETTVPIPNKSGRDICTLL